MPHKSKHNSPKLSLIASQLVLATLLSTTTTGCSEQGPVDADPAAQAQESTDSSNDSRPEAFPLPEPAAVGEAIDEAQFFNKLEASLPSNARDRVERAFKIIQRGDEQFEGMQIAQIIPMHFLTNAKVHQVEVKLTRNGESSGYLNLALSKHNDRVWFDSDSESAITPVQALIRKYPKALHAVKLYQIGLVDVAAEDENGNLLGYLGLDAPAPGKLSEFWTKIKERMPEVELAENDSYGDEDAIYPENPDSYTKSCEGNRMYKKVLRDKGLPVWKQFTVERKGEHCAVGGTPLAMGMALAWMDVAWPSVNFIMGPGKETMVDDNNRFGPAPTLIREIADTFGTYCGHSDEDTMPGGATVISDIQLQRSLNHVLKYKNRGKTDVRAKVVDYRNTSHSEIEDDIFNELRYRKRPVVIGGRLSKIPRWKGDPNRDGHAWGVDGVRYPSIKGCDSKHRKVRMNWGWDGTVSQPEGITKDNTTWMRLNRFSSAVNRVTYFTHSINDCDLPVGHKNYCDQCGPCGYGDGHCRNHSECEGDLVCEANQGKRFGFEPSRSVCVSPEVSQCERSCHSAFDDCINATGDMPGEKPDIRSCRFERSRCLDRC